MVGPMIVPVDALGMIMQDVIKTLVSYAPLLRHHLNSRAVPHVPPAIVAMPHLGVKYHHSMMAAFKVLERIQTGIGLPASTALAAGTASNSAVLNFI